MSCQRERIEIPIGSDFKLMIQLTRIDGAAIPPDSVAWELRFASREKLYANYIVKSSEMGAKWHEVEGSDKILVPIPSDHGMAPGELCCKIRYSTPDAQFSDDSYDAESTWRIVELGGDGGSSLTLVSTTRAGYSKFPEDMEFAVVLPQGERGEAGKDAYESAVEHGYTGTKEEFYQSLVSVDFAKEWAEDVLKETTENFPAGSRQIDYHLEKEREAINKKSYPPIPFEAPMADRVQAIDRIEGEIEKTYRELGMDWIIDNEILIKNARDSAKEVESWGQNLIYARQNNSVLMLMDFTSINTGILAMIFYLCTKLIYIKNINIPEVTATLNLGAKSPALVYVDGINMPKTTTLEYAFSACDSLERVENINVTSALKNIGYMFGSCPNLHTVSAINCAGVTASTYGLFVGSPNIKHFGGFINMGISFSLSAQKLLTRESLVDVFKGVRVVAQGSAHIVVGPENMAKLTEDDKSTLLVKGWTLYE